MASNRYTGPAMTLENMRSNGVHSIEAGCECARRVSVDVAELSGSIEVPALKRRLRCAECGGRPIDVWPDWRNDRASGNGR